MPGQGQITYNTYQWNSPAKVTLPGGSSTEYTYDPLMQVQSIISKDPAQNTLMTRSYDYSPAGNITTKDTEHGAYTYQYDELYRLTQATNPTLPNEAYTYDLLGNRLTSANTTGSWTYNLNNELGGYDHVSYVYDANGNLTNKTSEANPTNYIYDVEDRLVRVEDGDGVVATYYYDPFGRRLWKEVDGTRTYFLYSDEGLIGEYDSTGNEIKTYGWTPDSIWGTDPLFQKIGDYYYFYQNDHLGTPQKLIGTNGLVVWAGVYDSFGNCQIEVAGITNNLRFAGQYYDQETGLHYNWLRYYDPGTGRYLRTDPFGEGLNLYVYCFGNPLNWVDPYGLCATAPNNAKAIFNPNTGIYTGILTIEDSTGKVLGQFPVGNITTRNSKGPVAPGVYPLGTPVKVDPTGDANRDGIPDGLQFGPYFIPVHDVPGRTGIGIHGGRSGPQSPTLGCFRMSNADVAQLVNINKQNPITQITVLPE